MGPRFRILLESSKAIRALSIPMVFVVIGQWGFIDALATNRPIHEAMLWAFAILVAAIWLFIRVFRLLGRWLRFAMQRRAGAKLARLRAHEQAHHAR